MKTNQHIFLPDDNLANKIEELCTIFQAVTKNLSISKHKPMSKETIEILNKFIPNKTPRIKNMINNSKKPTIKLTKELTKMLTTLLTKKTVTIHNNHSHSLRVDQALNFKIK